MSSETAVVSSCKSCSKIIEQGEVVAFSNSVFHVDCFICSKCRKSIENKSDVLALENGTPLCNGCSYACSACNQKIENEAILTNDQVFHSKCFTCNLCNKHLNNLIFTQTEKGIYCANCHKSKENSFELSKKKSDSLSVNDSGSNKSLDMDSFLPDATLSFFESESSDLANLSSSLGVYLSQKSKSNSPSSNDRSILDESFKMKQTRINRASEILQRSLRTKSIISKNSFGDNFNSANSENSNLQESNELKLKYEELETNYKSLENASEQALSELNKIKDDLLKESNIKKQLELTIVALLKKNGSSLLSRKKLDRLASLRVDLEKACKEISDQRDKIATSIDASIDESLILSTYQNSLVSQIKLLQQEKNTLQSETKELQQSRDDIINEIVILNTKNSELASMHNELSRRNFEKERKASISPPLSPSHSIDTVSSYWSSRSRKASEGSSNNSYSSSKLGLDQQNNLARAIKTKGSTVFSKLSGSTSTPSSPVRIDSSFSTSPPSIYKGLPNQSEVFNSPVQYNSRSMFKGNKQFMSSMVSLKDIECQHFFQPYSFIRPVKCGVCEDKFWGRTEHRCDHCGFVSHSKCLNNISQQNLDEINRLSNDSSSSHHYRSFSIEQLQPSTSTSTVRSRTDHKKNFSVTKSSNSDNSPTILSLIDRCKIENRLVPYVVEECIKEVELRGLDYEGIYRKSGGAAQTRIIYIAFETGKKINLRDECEFNDICAITSALKQYFRDLPNPLLTFELYSKFVELSVLNNDEQKLQAFKELLAKLPKAHFHTMAFLFKHLVKIIEQSNVNKMTAKNLAMVFAPTLMRHSDPSTDFLDISYKNATIEYLLLYTSNLFSDIPE